MEIEKEYKIGEELHEIQSILIDMEYYGRLHPLIKAVKIIESNPQEFRIKEKPYKWMPIHIQYSVTVKSAKNTVDYEIAGIPFSKVNIGYVLNEMGEMETQILFNLKIEGKLIGKKILLNKMVAAQDQLMESMRKELE